MVTLSYPLHVHRYCLPNRIVFPPIQTRSSTKTGEVTSKLLEHYVQRTPSLGLLIVEHGYVSQDGKLNNHELGIHEDYLLPGLRRLTTRLHAFPPPLILQINHAGALTQQSVIGMHPLAPSASDKAREIAQNDIETLLSCFTEAAERAIHAGFDGIELHGAHGFLLNQFTSPLTNHRTDAYGGTSEKRIRFPLELVEQIKARIGDRLLLYRLGADDLDSNGVSMNDTITFAMKLVEAGVDILDVSGGICGSRPQQLQNTQGFFIPQANEIKTHVSIPVIGVGGIVDPEFANALIKDSEVDLVAVGRALLKDPLWAHHAIIQSNSSS
ncbi:MAG: NADH:flavin oxidoreductase [Candidatus Bathyarchaeota archaeon]|nr:NADH:flavin oxidoreductase [Candidatus Bathyarchaeota archaeon]